MTSQLSSWMSLQLERRRRNCSRSPCQGRRPPVPRPKRGQQPGCNCRSTSQMRQRLLAQQHARSGECLLCVGTSCSACGRSTRDRWPVAAQIAAASTG